MPRTSEAGIALLKAREVFVGYVYDDQDKAWPRRRLLRWEDCRGTATVGYGHVYPRGGALPHDITEPEADLLMRAQLGDYEAAVVRWITAPLNAHQFDALVSFAFNEGINSLNPAQCQLAAAINGGHTDTETLVPLFLLWDKWRVDGLLVRNEGLHTRRGREAALFCEPMPEEPIDSGEILARVYASADRLIGELLTEARRRDTEPAPKIS